MRKFFLLFCLPWVWLAVGLLSEADAQAPLKNNFNLKADPVAGVFGEFRLVFEKRLTRKIFLYSAAGYYYRENARGSLTGATGGPQEVRVLYDFFRHNRFVHSSAINEFDDANNFREKIRGPVLRAGFRFFVKPTAPEGTFFHLAISYGLLFSNYQTPATPDTRLIIQRPGVNFAVGRQWLFGNHRNFVFNIFGGAEYLLLLNQDKLSSGNVSLTPIPLPKVYAGLEVGFAFRRKHRHW